MTHFTANGNSTPGIFQNGFHHTKKQILFASVPGDGHVNPLIPLAVYLKEQGHDVHWYTSVNYAEKIEKLGIKHYPLKRALDLSLPVDDLFPERKNIHNRIKRLSFDLINGFILRAPEYYEDIKEIHHSFQFDVVVADCMFYAIPFLKQKLQVPVISIGVLPLTESSKDIAPPGLGVTPPVNFFQKVKCNVLSIITSMLFIKPTKAFRSILQQYNISMHTGNLFDYVTREASLFLQIGTPGFEYYRSDLGSNIRFIGASLPKAKNTKAWHHPKFLQYTKIILVTQGTVEKDISKLIIPTLAAFKNTEYLVIVTTGGSHTEELKQQFNYDNIIIEDFIPFDQVMPMVHLYITNGGYGGVTYSIINKLPMVVAGIHEGKSEINARVGYFKLGINLRTERPTPFQIKSAAEKVLNDDVYKQNVTSLAKEFSKYNAAELCALYINEEVKKQQKKNYFKQVMF